MIEWVVSSCMLILLITVIRQLFRKRPGRAAGVLTAVAVLAVVALTVTFTGRREPDVPTDVAGKGNLGSTDRGVTDTVLFDPPLQADLLLKTDSRDPAGESGGEAEEQSGGGYVFGYSDYTGYLDECGQWLYYVSFTECDYDGDGLIDRVWRENIQDWGVADYHIEFGNGDVIELPKTAGGIPEVRSLDLEGDGVREILFTETFGYSTDPKAYGQMALLRKVGEHYEMVELPAGISRVGSEEQTYDGTMVRYQPSLSLRYTPAGEYRMRVTCPTLENVEGMESLDVTVDFTQEEWEMGNYGEFYPNDVSSVPYQVDILSLGNGRDALRLYFGVLDKWCDDDIVMTLEWEDESLSIGEIRYWHDYVETAYAEIGGQQYELILRGSGYVGGDQYTIDSILVNYIHYEERFKGLVEDTVQFIDPGDAARQYWGEGYASDGGVMAKAVSSGRNGNILIEDLNFDGNEDFCIQGWIAEGGNIPYYCYFWNEDTGQFEYGGCLTNVAVDDNLKCIKSVVNDGEGGYGVGYYRYEDGALTELYQMTGTKVKAAYFAVTEYGDFHFASTGQELKAGQANILN